MSEHHGPKTSARIPPAATWARLSLVLAVLIGITAGIGGYTFRYARGLSYLSTDPQACVNCHIMQPQYDAWRHSSHREVAVCVDCHLPEALLAKYVTKAENGWRHGKLFTTQQFAEPITVHAAGRATLQENCVRCHEPLVHELSPGEELARARPGCVHCHAGVGHGERAGLGGSRKTAPAAAKERTER